MTTQAPKIQLIFWSRRNCGDDTAEARQQIGEMIQQARHQNGRKGITGALLSMADGFWQVLEGPQHEIEELFERIRSDNRHRAVLELNRRFISERQFAGFALGYIDENSSSRAAMQNRFGTTSPEPRRVSVESIASLMQAQLSLETGFEALAA